MREKINVKSRVHAVSEDFADSGQNPGIWRVGCPCPQGQRAVIPLNLRIGLELKLTGGNVAQLMNKTVLEQAYFTSI